MMTTDGDGHGASSFSWTIESRRIDLAHTPLIMGILNVTPDSFHDGGRYLDETAAIRHAERMLEEGADLVDAGAESTRPGAEDVPPEIQVERLRGVVAALCRNGAMVSIDTRRADVATPLLALGARVVNDVSGLADPGMAPLVAQAGASLVVMHMKGSPRTMQIDPRYDDLVGEIRNYLRDRITSAEAAGIDRGRIAIDPGIGFGKTPGDNLRLIGRLDQFLPLDAPILVGISRKSFLGVVDGGGGTTTGDRLAGSLAASVVAYERGARIFRTHDPAETRRALRAAEALHAESQRDTLIHPTNRSRGAIGHSDGRGGGLAVATD